MSLRHWSARRLRRGGWWLPGVAWLVALTVAPVAAQELEQSWRHWSRFREIRVATEAASGQEASGRLERVAIPEELFEQARSDLADLRIVDDAGQEVGFVLFTRGSGPATEWRPTELSEAGFVPGEYTQVVADTGDSARLHNAVEVTLPQADEEYFSWVEVAASDDRENWRIVRARAALYRFHERGFGRAVGIGYPRTRDRWLRLRLLDGDAEVPIERLRVSERADEERAFGRVRRALVRSADSPAGESWWQPGGRMSELPIAAVRFDTERAAFHRPVTVSVSDDERTWRQVGQGNIYRYEPDEGLGDDPDRDEPRQSLQVDLRDTAAPFWRVTILDRSDAPIDDLEVTLMQERRYAVFRPRAGQTYRLLYGNPRAEPPEYELGKIVSRDALAAAALVELGEERVNQAWVSSEPFTERHPVILWIALGLAVTVIAGLALKTLRSTR